MRSQAKDYNNSNSKDFNINNAINNNNNNDRHRNNDHTMADHTTDDDEFYHQKSKRNNNDSKVAAYCTLRRSRSSSVPSDDNNLSKIDLTEKFYTVNRKLQNFIKSGSKTIQKSNNDINSNTTLSYSKLHESESRDFGFSSITSTSSSSSLSASESCVASAINYGISQDLSTESIKDACDCFEELNDAHHENDNYHNRNNDDNICRQRDNYIGNSQQKNTINVSTSSTSSSELTFNNQQSIKHINTESNHNCSSKKLNRSSLLRFSTLDRRKMIKDHFHPYCTIRRGEKNINSNENDKNELQSANDDVHQTSYHYRNNSSIKPAVASNLVLIENDRNNENTSNNVENENVIMTKAVINKEHPYPSYDGSLTSAEAFNILNELDAILNNHSTSTIEAVSSSASSTVPSSPRTQHISLSLSRSRSSSSSPITMATTSTNQTESITTEKIEDCLLELDAYLEQIDNQNNNNNNNNDVDDDDNDNEDQFDDKKSIISNKNEMIPRLVKRSKTLPRKYTINLQSINGNFSESINKNSSSAIPKEETSFIRGLKQFRNTIGTTPRTNQFSNTKNMTNASKIIDQNPISTDDDDKVSSTTSINFPKTWRRCSMRKTSLFTLPDQKISTPTKKFSQTSQNNADNNQITGNNSLSTSISTSTSHQTVATTSLSSQPSISNFNNNNNNNTFTNEGFQASDEGFISNDATTRRCLSYDYHSNHHIQNLTHLDIIHDILQNASQSGGTHNRPRQLGRRADQHPRIVSIMAETNPLSGNQRIIVNHDRPSSAPAAAGVEVGGSIVPSSVISRPQIGSTLNSDCSRFVGSETSSVGSSRNPSPVSLISSTASSSTTSAIPDRTTTESQLQRTPITSEPTVNHQIHVPRRNGENNSQWPHGFSRILALLCCTLGLFNISRFSILTIHYGGNFLLQFLLLSIIFGIPMMWLQMSLGAKIKRGPVSMWKISPICKGIGIALIIAQCIIALYSTVSLGWVMVYLRDSFISRNEYYRWQEPFSIYRRSNISSTGVNNLTETVADYFNGIVLQRWQLSLGRKSDSGGVRFQLAFNLAVIWIAVFIVLCKGLKSFGKLVLGLTLIPIMLFIVVTCKLLYIIDFSSGQNIFLASDFEDFLINSKTWTAAAQETFLTWTLLGPSIIAISSKSAEKTEGKTILRRDAVLVVIITLFGLSLAAIFGFACVQILQNNDYLYIPGSFEYLDTYTFLYSLRDPIPHSLLSIPIKWSPHYSSILGECYRRFPTSVTTAYRESGYQALRLVTELFPATVAVATQESISSVWSIMIFLMFLLFGLGQLCAMWKPISSALGDSTSSVLLSCVTGLLLGIPFATEMGLSIIHYLDTVLGGAWWILILWTAQILAVFLIRGRPYNGDDLVKDLRMGGSMSAFLALSWNVLLPVGLITLAIIEYRISFSNQFFHWRNKSYFHIWARKVGGLIQISFLMIIPITTIIQIYRYLTNGPPDILDRIQLLYRPSETPFPHRRSRPNAERSSPAQTATIGVTSLSLDNSTAIQDDAPPKYTPPPSYTTATGARIAKLFRQSIRRSVRRILGETNRNRPSISLASNNFSPNDSSLPPEYSTVSSNPTGGPVDVEINPRISHNNSYIQAQLHQNLTSINRPSSETFSRSIRTTTSAMNRNRRSPSYTAFDVAQILRSSSTTSSPPTSLNHYNHHHHHERSVSAITTGFDNVLKSSSLRFNHNKSHSRSAENLVLNIAPLGESNAIISTDTTETEEHINDQNHENTSVI